MFLFFLSLLLCCFCCFVVCWWPSVVHVSRSNQSFTPSMTAFANASLHLVNYPVKVTVKSFKLIPTMFVATQLLRKKYDRWQYAAAALLCLGLAQFLLSDRRTSTRPSSPLGLFFLVVSCCVDAFAPVLQDQAMNKLESPPLFVMSFVSCFLVFFCIFIFLECLECGGQWLFSL